MTDTAVDVCSRGLRPPEAPRPDQRGGRHSHACADSAEHTPKVLSYSHEHRVALICVFVWPMLIPSSFPKSHCVICKPSDAAARILSASIAVVSP